MKTVAEFLREEGFKEGFREGRREALFETARRLLAKKYSPEDTMAFTGLSRTEIQKLSNEDCA
jgi:hypothetical protein